MSETILTNAPTAPAARLGAELRNARLSLGWELGDLARALRIRQAYLEAIEAGRMADLPGATYALGFVRTYASALGLPGEQVASRLRAETAEANIRPALSFPAPVPQRGVPAGALMLLGLVVLAGAYSGWYYFSEHQRTPARTVPPIPDRMQPSQSKPAPSPQVASILPGAAPPAPAPPERRLPEAASPPGGIAQPAPAASNAAPGAPDAAGTPNAPPGPAASPSSPVPPPSMALGSASGEGATGVSPSGTAPGQPASGQAGAGQPNAAAPAGPNAAEAAPPGTRMVIKASADAWVTVKPKGGGPALLNKLLHAGDSWPVPASDTNLVMTTGNAGGTEIDVDGAAVPSLGGSGMVRRDLPLDPDTLKAGNFAPIGKGRKAALPPSPDE